MRVLSPSLPFLVVLYLTVAVLSPQSVHAEVSCPVEGSNHPSIKDIVAYSKEATADGATEDAFQVVFDCVVRYCRLDCTCWQRLGREFIAQGEHGHAITLINGILEEITECLELHTLIGTAYARGSLADAALSAFDHVLRSNPRSIETLHERGVLFHRLGKYDKAARDLERASKGTHAEPKRQAESLYFLANVYREQGRTKRSEKKYRECLKKDPEHQKAATNLGIVLYERGDVDGAISMLQIAVDLDPSFLPPRLQLGAIEFNSKRLTGARKTFRAIFEEHPSHHIAAKYLAITEAELSGPHDGIAVWERYLVALRDNEGDKPKETAEALSHRADLLLKLNAIDTALNSTLTGEETLKEALRSPLYQFGQNSTAVQEDKHQLLQLWSKLCLQSGKLHTIKQDWSTAESRFMKCYELGNKECLYHLAKMFLKQGHKEDALEVLTKAAAETQGTPAFTKVGLLTSDLLVEKGDYEVALAGYLTTLQNDKTCARCLTEATFLKHRVLDWRGLRQRVKNVVTVTKQELERGRPPTVAPFHLLYYNVSQSFYLDVARAVSLGHRKIADSFPDPEKPMLASSDRAHKVRIGLLSRDFSNSPTAYLLRAVVTELKKSYPNNVHTIAYPLSADDGSEWRRFIVEGTDEFRHDFDASNITIAANAIRSDRLDIVINLDTHLRDPFVNHLWSKRLAPVQIAYLGYPGSTGAPWADYLVTDSIATPVTTVKEQISERAMLLPKSFQPNSHALNYPDLSRSRKQGYAPGAVDEDTFVFCNYNQLIKMNPPLLRAWSAILNRVAREGVKVELHMLYTPKMAADILRETLAGEYSIPRKFFRFLSRSDPLTYIQRASRCDLFLDNFLVNAHTTAADVLWAGVPILTKPGFRMSSRIAASQLAAHLASPSYTDTLRKLTASSIEDYIETAYRLATTPGEMKQVRRDIDAARVNTSTRGRLFDTVEYTKGLVRAMQMGIEVKANSGRKMHVVV